MYYWEEGPGKTQDMLEGMALGWPGSALGFPFRICLGICTGINVWIRISRSRWIDSSLSPSVFSVQNVHCTVFKGKSALLQVSSG